MRYDFHPQARVEYLEAAAFYEQRQEGLGARFTLAIEATIERILDAPKRWRLLEGEVSGAAFVTNSPTACSTR